MRAVVATEPRTLRVEEVPDPEPGEDQVVLRVAACGICGTDLHLHQLGLLPPGAVLGHEFCGEVMETKGELRAGDRVTALPTFSCGACERCRRGLGMYCERQTAIGLGAAPGALAEYVAVARHEVIALPDGVDFARGAMVEPLAVGLHTVHRAGLRRGERCLVVGAGPIGLAITLWARHLGAGEVVVSEPHAGRRELAERLGASVLVDPESEDLAGVLARVAPGGPEVIIEAVGAPGMLAHCLDHAAFRSRLVVAGVCMTPDTIAPAAALAREVEMHFSCAYEKDDFHYTVDMLDRGRIDPTPMLSERVGFEGVAAAFDALASPDGPCKVLVEPRGTG